LQSFLLIHDKKLNQQDKKEQVLWVLSNNHFLVGEGRGREQRTIMIYFHIINLKIIILWILKQGKKMTIII
jgi:hypothetical protein